MECPCGGSTASVRYEVGTYKDQQRFCEPVPVLGSVVQIRTCTSCTRVDKQTLYVDPNLIKEKLPEPPSTNSLLNFF